MSRRKNTPIKKIEPELLDMLKAGYTRHEIADHFDLEKSRIDGWTTRDN